MAKVLRNKRGAVRSGGDKQRQRTDIRGQISEEGREPGTGRLSRVFKFGGGDFAAVLREPVVLNPITPPAA